MAEAISLNRCVVASSKWLAAQAGCGHDFTVTAGTLFADTHLPLRLWFQAMWYVVNQKNGASALGVQRVLGLGSYRTAWRWLHKLRRAMVRPGRDRLSGTVEVDEVYIGGERPGKRGRGAGQFGKLTPLDCSIRIWPNN